MVQWHALPLAADLQLHGTVTAENNELTWWPKHQRLQKKMADLLSWIVPLAYAVNEQFLDCLEGVIAFLETTLSGSEHFFQWLWAWFTLGHVLGAVLNHSATRHYVLHVNISTPGWQLHGVESCCPFRRSVLWAERVLLPTVYCLVLINGLIKHSQL